MPSDVSAAAEDVIADGLCPPSLDIDLYAPDVMADPYPTYRRIRETAKIVWIPKHSAYYTVDYDIVRHAFGTWQDFSSTGGIGLRDLSEYKAQRAPGILLESDPPDHTRYRTVMSRLLSPIVLKRLRSAFEAVARPIVAAALAKGSVNVVDDLVRPFILHGISDVVGVPREGREHLWTYGQMVLDLTGPENALAHESLRVARDGGAFAWVEDMQRRDAFSSDGLAAELFTAADTGEITEADASMLSRIFLSAAVDSTSYTIINGIKAFVDNPDQWALLSADPSLARSAFEEVLRYAVAPQALHRRITHDLAFAGYALKAGQRFGLGNAAANRDPAKFEDPERFNIRRKVGGHLAFGFGIHACVGQMVARMEAEILYGLLATSVAEIRPAGAARPFRSNALSSWSSLPVTLIPKS